MSDTQFATIESGDGIKLDARIFKPSSQQNGNLVVVLVHPYSVLGGCQGLMKGIGRGLANQGVTSVTFDTRGAGRSTGKASITGSAEVNDVVGVCKWALDNLSAQRILLVGSSAGAAVAGSAVDRVEQIVGYVSLGYPFGFTASILFGGHNKAILKSSKPKLFVMGTKDGFTNVKQLENKLKSAAGRNDIHLLEGVSHFQMEGPDYDAQMIKLILEFIASL
ncbi:serine protease [Lithospermum erythrorhizon]|uniref:Serine protease n=1 Tax=Lithospermum erythrorhizon TaxID=34254 RepID=A0AAV3PJ29_LITER